jgi:hypothetical protein
VSAKVSKVFFYALKIIIIMAKIILTNGVINVTETYEELKERFKYSSLLDKHIELNEDIQELKNLEKFTNQKTDCKVLISVEHIQCIKR